MIKQVEASNFIEEIINKDIEDAVSKLINDINSGSVCSDLINQIIK